MDFSPFPRHIASPARTLFRRCVQCPDVTPSCPQCAADEECSFNIGGCDACPSNQCIKQSSVAPGGRGSQSSPAGPIAGGVIGGIAVVSIIVFLLYWFYIRKRRQEYWPTQLENLKSEGEKTPDQQSFAQQRSRRASTHTVASVKTTGSRASNVIQIAYIPGVTNRSDGASPEILPPVPPIPAAGTTSPHLNTGTEHFFMPVDLRPESAYMDDTTDSRKSIARSPARSSFAASEYQSMAVVEPMPARAAVAARAVPISVKSSMSRLGSIVSTPDASHQNSIAGRMAGPVTATAVQARPIMITQSTSNLKTEHIHELDDTSTGAPTPKIGASHPSTLSPKSAASEDSESGTGARFGIMIGDKNRGVPSPRVPVSAVRSEFSRNSPVSTVGWEPPSASIRDTIQNATTMAYGQHGGAADRYGNEAKSPFADSHAARTP